MLCGIAGEVAFQGARADPASVKRMARVLGDPNQHNSIWHDPWIALSQVPLQNDTSDNALQPTIDADRDLAIVFSGRLFNQAELLAQLSIDYSLRSTTDADIVLAAYDRWGEDFVERLLGSFAIAITDRRRQRVLLIRDRLGIQPLYIASLNGKLRFASTLPALAASGGIATTIDPVALHHYMSWHSIVPAPRTILAGIKKLPPATIQLIESDGQIRERVYWKPNYQRSARYADWRREDWQQAIHQALQTAVTRSQVPNEPPGVQLSGGLDSSLLVALLAESGQQQISTFSIGFDDAGDNRGNEFRYSEKVADAFGTDHHVLRLGASDVADVLDDAVLAMAEPMASHDVPAFYLHAQSVVQQAKSLQCGQGADEIFAGYSYHGAAASIPRQAALATFADSFVDNNHQDLAGILNPQWLTHTDVSNELLAEALDAPGADTALDAVLRLETQLFLADDPVKRVTNMSMATGLEACLPFLDHELIELVIACPNELKAAQGGKGILKDIGRSLLPHDVIDRPKGYFPVPALGQLEGTILAKVREALLAPEARERGLFRAGYLDTLLTNPNVYYVPTGGNTLWKLGVLELWLQHHDLG
ncbi:MAG TPA: N-acetylglutaminylglutamine amidotransferase [Candidatus Yaniella excrementigallinarum]|nr:N-acetylglutaminylglutamine amidotransferase [Candidatus Yaniella excrementigallinarum]